MNNRRLQVLTGTTPIENFAHLGAADGDFALYQGATSISANLWWDSGSTNATGWEVERSVDGGQTYSQITGILPANTCSYVDPALPASGTLAYEVVAVNSYGTSSGYMLGSYTQNGTFYPWSIGLPQPVTISATADDADGTVSLEQEKGTSLNI